jgi:hypothetical protein
MKFSISLVLVALSLGVSALPAPVNNEARWVVGDVFAAAPGENTDVPPRGVSASPAPANNNVRITVDDLVYPFGEKAETSQS